MMLIGSGPLRGLGKEAQPFHGCRGARSGHAGPEPCRKHGVRDASIYKWKAKVRRHGRVRSEDAGGREHEGSKPVGKEVLTPTAKRNAIAHLMSERRRVRTIGFCRMTIRYETSATATYHPSVNPPFSPSPVG